jgi:hypothetical protein
MQRGSDSSVVHLPPSPVPHHGCASSQVSIAPVAGELASLELALRYALGWHPTPPHNVGVTMPPLPAGGDHAAVDGRAMRGATPAMPPPIAQALEKVYHVAGETAHEMHKVPYPPPCMLQSTPVELAHT